MRLGRITAILAVVVAVVGCSQPLTTREKGALTGGAIGAGTGAIIGSQTGHTGTGALIGAGIGAVSGAVIGDAIQGAEKKKQATATPAAAPPAPPPPQRVAVATPPPVVVQSPRMIWVPDWGMYVLEGHDIVYYNNAYYYLWNGRWYVSQAHSGPWTVVGTPPPGLAKLPPGQFAAHLPPGLAKKGKVPPGHRR